MELQKGWRDWYHCYVGTYAQWLPGDDRGWRERNHHEHVAGDYNNPPKPSKFSAKRLENSKKLVQGDPYFIIPKHRPVIGSHLLKSFEIQQIPILALAVSAKNFHALIQCRDASPKLILGHAKKHATFNFAAIADAQMRQRQKLWETGSGVEPIADQAHAYRAFNYILDHWRKEGAWVWSYRDGPLPVIVHP